MGNSKKLGLGSAISVAVGLIVATSCLLSLGQGIGLAGKAFVGSLFIVLILNGMLAISFGELYSLMPKVEGGLGQYTLVGLGPIASIISNFSAYVFTNLLAITVEMTMCGMIIHQCFLPNISPIIISTVLLIILTIVNYKGVDVFSKVQNFSVVLLIGSFILLGIISYFKLGTGHVITEVEQTLPTVTGFSGILSLSALAFWLFIGIEFVIPVAKDLKNPKRDVFLAMILGILLLFAVQSLLGVGMTNYVTLSELSNSELPHMVFAENCLGKIGIYWMGIVTLLAGISSVNTALGSVSRILCGMAENELMPKVFMKKNKDNVPLGGLAVLSIGVLIILLSGLANSSGLTNLILAASCFWLTSYILINISVIVLRKKYPNAEGRNKKLVFFNIPQIICILGNIFMIANIAEGADRIFIYKLYIGILATLIVFSIIWIKGVKKTSLFKSPSIEDINEGVDVGAA